MIRDTQELVATIGRPAPRTTAMTPDEIDSFLRGFGLNGRQVRLIRSEWEADHRRAYSSGFDDDAESVRDDPDYYT